ncbi:hypothetical protein EDB85DRAFT_2272081 [Lactarius pseudohatsudake]|nr:hypothetical protein EDB85DRAFT_2272081 [Lactarius pseudohatsudake]
MLPGWADYPASRGEKRSPLWGTVMTHAVSRATPARTTELRLGLGWAGWARRKQSWFPALPTVSRAIRRPPSRVVRSEQSWHLQDDFGSPASLSKTPDAFGQSASFARDACVFPRSLCGTLFVLVWSCTELALRLQDGRARLWQWLGVLLRLTRAPPAWEVSTGVCWLDNRSDCVHRRRVEHLITAAKTHDASHQSQAITMVLSATLRSSQCCHDLPTHADLSGDHLTT